MTRNLAAFLSMIAHSEGTDRVPNSDGGYRVLVGGGTFEGYADHPRIFVDLPRLGIKSSAAGRYQILARIYDAYKALLNLPDFSPASQDAIAVQLIKEQKAIASIETGDFAGAVRACRHIWASLPDAGYQQHENTLADLRSAYVAAGGFVIEENA